MDRRTYQAPQVVEIGRIATSTLNSGGSCNDGVHTGKKAVPPGLGTCNQFGNPGNSGTKKK